MKKSDNKTDFEYLRKKAELLLKGTSADTDQNLIEADILKLVNELEIYKIELELQNDELKLANSTASEAVEKYTELYDFAPSGYFTLSKEGFILELNLIGAKMLGKDRSYFINKSFNSFLSSDSKTLFNRFLEKLSTSNTNETVELEISKNGNNYQYF